MRFSAQSDSAERWCQAADEVIAFLKEHTAGPDDAFALLEFMLLCHEDEDIREAWY